MLLKALYVMQVDQLVLKIQMALSYSAQKVAMESLRGGLSKAAEQITPQVVVGAVDQQVQIRSRDPSH